MTESTRPFTTVHEALVAAASARGRATALVHEGVAIDYEELLRRVDAAAGVLRARGIGPGATFAACCQNCPQMIHAYYAAAKLGAVLVPLNPNLSAPELGYAFRHSGSRFLLHDAVVEPTARAAVEAGALVPIAALEQPPATATEEAGAQVRREDDFVVIYTSGSTGTPKAIVLDHAAQVDAGLALARMWSLDEQDVTLVALPLGYLYGLSTAAGAALQSGGRVALLRRFHPRDVLDAFVAHRATIFHGVPTMYSMMLEYCEQNDLRFDLSHVRQLICAGAPLPDEVRRRFSARFGADIHNYYAATEATPVFCCYADDPRSPPEGAAGRMAPGVRVRIVRADGTDCEVGEQGEVLVRAAATMKRYLGDPELTAAVMQDGLFRTGDLGYRDADGWYYISGRIKDVIIRGGANISPAEVERVLCAHPDVQDAAVVGAPDAIFGEVPVAFVVARHGATPTAESLMRHAEAALSDFKVPRRYSFEKELPQGRTGKVDKAVLRRRCEAG